MNFEIQILGSGSAIPTKDRSLTAQIITAYKEPYLIDCGEGTQLQMRRFDVKFSKIKHIFISHLHGDHFFGLFGLISTYNLLGRKSTLNIYAHKELEDMLLCENSPLKIDELVFDIKFHHLSDEEKIIYENNNLIVKSFPLNHRIKTCGFLFQQKVRQPNIIKEKITEFNLSIQQILDLKAGKDIEIDNKLFPNNELTNSPPAPKSYAYCSDTAYFENIIPIIQNTDLLFHEATFSEKDAMNAEKTGHSTASDAANIAQKANVKQLLIGHFSTRYPNLNYLLKEAQNIFPNTILTEDGLVIEIS
ncbi:MAG: ribonuclease Z [Bacteroidales bacterium]|nr:ribonuclease Z [Bacteroidales bacterium]